MAGKTRFSCQECGYQVPRWLGRCPGCGAWNTLVESLEQHYPLSAENSSSMRVYPITELPAVEEERFSTGIQELDRVLGGGVVPASLVLLGGDPGIGKSTLLLQAAGQVSNSGRRVLYASGEESVQQVRLRATRLNIQSPSLYLAFETDIYRLERYITALAPAMVVVDSIQTTFKNELGSAPGSVGQVRECTVQLMRLAKEQGISVFLVGHVTKEGLLAGPRLLEHIVDTVLYFEGERHQSFRLLRAVKNRFGSTNEIGVFEMQGGGLVEVSNPSALFIHHLKQSLPGSIVVPTLEGTRPLLVEIQALVSPTSFGTPRRMTTGVDYNRVVLLMAVLEKRVGLYLGGCDAYVNAVGGVRITEPAADLGIALALASSFYDRPVKPDLVAVGEVGLSGELRPVTGVEKRIGEAIHLGFSSCLIPEGSSQQINSSRIKTIEVQMLAEAIELALQR